MYIVSSLSFAASCVAASGCSVVWMSGYVTQLGLGIRPELISLACFAVLQFVNNPQCFIRLT
jgi:hypothetical protein